MEINWNEGREHGVQLHDNLPEDGFSMTDYDRAWRESVDSRLIALETVLYRHGKLLEQIISVVDKQPVVKPKRSNQRKAVEYSDRFEELWAMYPARSGSNPKQKAQSAYLKHMKTDRNSPVVVRAEILSELHREIRKGVALYNTYCAAENMTGTKYVMQAATFFGPDKHWENEWKLSPSVPVDVPKELNALVRYAAKSGLQAKVGEPLHEFRARVIREVAGSDE